MRINFKETNFFNHTLTHLFQNLKRFLSSRREEWEMRQKETEAKFLELSSLSEKLAAIPSEPKKRKRKAKTDSYPQQQHHFATYEAEIQVTFFKKVMHHYFSLCVIVSFFNKFLADITRLFGVVHQCKKQVLT